MSVPREQVHNAVEELVQERIAASPAKMIPWHDVMELALYAPDAGYYRREVRRIGRSGDFYTSVSVGPVFGELLASFCAQVWRRIERPARFAIIEQGANDGTLALDILDALSREHPEVFAAVEYWIVEPDKKSREAQGKKTSVRFQTQLHHVESLQELDAAPESAVFLCNELLDAFSIHLVRFDGDEWQERNVTLDPCGELAFADVAITDAALKHEVEKLSTDFPNGYTTELNLQMSRWLRAVSSLRFRGALLILDYGLSASEYFSPARTEGTLRRYFRHQTDGRVLENLGECDLTSHVNFTRLAQEACALGLEISEFIEQGRFLTKLAAEKLAGHGGAVKPEWIRQFQALTHPNHLGMSFHALVLEKGLPAHGARDAALRRLGL